MSLSTSRLTALQYRDFRLLWFGQLVSTLGSQMSFVAINWHLYTILKDQTWAISILGSTLEIDLGALGLGLGGLVRVIPIMAFALLGGVLADIIPRRSLMMAADSVSALVAITLTLLTFFRAGPDQPDLHAHRGGGGRLSCEHSGPSSACAQPGSPQTPG